VRFFEYARNRWDKDLASVILKLAGIESDREVLPVDHSRQCVLFLGDSIAEGMLQEGYEHNPLKSWTSHAAGFLDVDYSNISFGGQGLCRGVSESCVPAGALAWETIIKQTGNAATPITPAAIYINLGTNDAINYDVCPEDFQTSLLILVIRLRAEFPGSWIFPVVPVGGFWREQFALLDELDRLVRAIDPKLESEHFLCDFKIGESVWGTDGIHPKQITHLLYGQAVAEQSKEYLGRQSNVHRAVRSASDERKLKDGTL
jgi:lysophospholipase L1-like esterase